MGGLFHKLILLEPRMQNCVEISNLVVYKSKYNLHDVRFSFLVYWVNVFPELDNSVTIFDSFFTK